MNKTPITWESIIETRWSWSLSLEVYPVLWVAQFSRRGLNWLIRGDDALFILYEGEINYPEAKYFINRGVVRSPYAAKHNNDAPPYHDRGAVGNAGDRWSFVQTRWKIDLFRPVVQLEGLRRNYLKFDIHWRKDGNDNPTFSPHSHLKLCINKDISREVTS